jgi:DNA repair photolyase
MIVSASYRTDIPAFYGPWFMNRLDAGTCMVANPYGGPDRAVSLRREDVDGFVFWTKNVEPFLGPLAEIARRGFPFVVQVTINAYPAALERSVPQAEQSIGALRTLANSYGGRAAVWRYDPVIVTGPTPPDWHAANFARLAAALRGASDEVVVSFAHIYRKTRRNLERAARAHGFAWRDPEPVEKETLAERLAGIAADHRMKLTICSQPALLVNGIEGAHCIDAVRLSDVAGRTIAAKTRGNREGCLCSESRDIGAYDTCPMGCVYCYAVSGREAAQRRLRDRSVDGTSLRESPPR